MIFRLIVRNIAGNIKTSALKVTGLTLMFLAILTISAWILNEFSYDKHFTKADRIYRFTVEQIEKERNFTWHFARTWQKWRRDIPGFFSEVEEMAELVPLFTTTVKVGTDKFQTRKAYASDTNFFKVFDLEFIEGDVTIALKDRNTMVVSESFAKKHFSDESPINKTLEIQGDYFDKFTVHTITGVYKDIPNNSHFEIDFLVNYPSPDNYNGNEWAFTYFLLHEGAAIESVRGKVPEFELKHVPEWHREAANLHFMKLTDIHLKSHIEREIKPNGDVKQVRLFSFILLGLLLLSLVNYINLNTVAFSRQIKTINITKLHGAKSYNGTLILMGETLVIILLAVILSFLLYKPFVTFLNRIEIDYTFNMARYYPQLLIIVMGIIVLFVISAVIPLAIIRIGQSSIFHQDQVTPLLNNKYRLLNNTMLVVQFTVSITVIICSFIFQKQNKFLLENQLGGKSNSICAVTRAFIDDEKDIELFCNEVSKFPEILDVTSTMEPPTYHIKDLRVVECDNLPENKKGQAITICPTDERFFNFFDINIIAGENLKPYSQDRNQINYLINNKAVRQLGFSSPEEAVGTEFKISAYNNDINYGGKIVGVVEDFHFSSLHHPITATAYFQYPKYYGTYLVNIKKGAEEAALKKMKEFWDREFSDYPFNYEFLNDLYANTYKNDVVQGRLFKVFAIISILLSSIGLIGIMNLYFIQKTKEIGIRKVNGSKIADILILLNKNFFKRVSIAFLIACPIAWYLMDNWFDNFAYKVSQGWAVYLLSGVLVLFIALLTVSYQSWRVATKNPVKALRYE